jgi:hypothetical protein
MNLKGYSRQQPWPILRYYFNILLEENSENFLTIVSPVAEVRTVNLMYVAGVPTTRH